MELRPPITPEDVQDKTSDYLREKLVISNLFQRNLVTYVQSHHDRILIGGISLHNGEVLLEAPPELSAAYLLERREMGLVCLTGEVRVTVDGSFYELRPEDIIYIGRGSKVIHLQGTAEIYFTSSMCHLEHPTTLIGKADADLAIIGDKKFASERSLRKYIHDQGVSSCSMAMGITSIHEGSVWNTMPCHVHERRTEVYLYFDLNENEKIIHLFGKPDQSRNFVLSNQEAVISPAWSIHTGAGTTNYKFVWSTAGENIAYTDFSLVETKNLK
ncbi:MAG: 5-dehydro-4-deoxy-D-glucuronate isomerase [Candidatus Planktophila sp.]